MRSIGDHGLEAAPLVLSWLSTLRDASFLMAKACQWRWAVRNCSGAGPDVGQDFILGVID
jgi:hypothetical protein